MSHEPESSAQSLARGFSIPWLTSELLILASLFIRDRPRDGIKIYSISRKRKTKCKQRKHKEQERPSRWRRSKTWRSPTSPQIHQKYIYMWNNSYRTPTERWQKTSDFPKGKKLPTYLDRAKEKRENRGKRIGMGPASLGGSYEGGKVSTHYEAPSWAETVGGGGGKLQGHGGEHSNRGAEGKVERFPHRGSVPNSIHQPERLVCPPTRVREGWELRLGLSEVRSQVENWGWLREHSLRGLACHS